MKKSEPRFTDFRFCRDANALRLYYVSCKSINPENSVSDVYLQGLNISPFHFAGLSFIYLTTLAYSASLRIMRS